MRKTKRIIISIIIIVIITLSPALNAEAPSVGKSVFFNGVKIVLSDINIKINGFDYIWLKGLVSSAGLKTSWNSNKNELLLVNGSKTIIVKKDDKKIYVNKAMYYLNAVAALKNGKLYVPLGFFTRNTSFTLVTSTSEIKITSMEKITPTPTPTSTIKPTVTPTVKPTATPTVKPTATPTVKPTGTPHPSASTTPTSKITPTPVITPTPIITSSPTISPTPTVKPDPFIGITNIGTSIENGFFYITINGNKPLKIKDYSATSPNSYIFDISGATLKIPEQTISVYNDFCIAIQYYQAKDKENTVRIKVIITKKVNYDIVYIDGNKTGRIGFYSKLKDLSIVSKGSDETVSFPGIKYGDWVIVYDKQMNRLSFTADKVLFVGKSQQFSTKNLKQVRIYRPADGKITVEMDLNDGVFYQSKNKNGELSIDFSTSPFNFFSYDKYGTIGIAELNYGRIINPKIEFDKSSGLFNITAGGYFEKLLGMFYINDNLVNYYQISTNIINGEKLTVVSFKVKQSVEPVLLPGNTGVYKIKFQKKAATTDQLTIAIDAGHGGSDPGASGYLNGATIQEKKVNLDVALRLDRILRENGFKTILTRKDDTYIQLGSRGTISNSVNADFFISIHHNSSVSSSTNGITTLYKLFDVSEIRPVTNKIIAMLFQTNLKAIILRKDIGISHRPELAVLRGTDMPGILVELGFLQNKKDLTEIVKYTYREKCARSLAISIIQYFNNYQSCALKVDTAAILNRSILPVQWQLYQVVVTPPPPYLTPSPSVTPFPSLTPTPTVTPTNTPSITPTNTLTPTPTLTIIPSPTISASPNP